MRLAKIICLTFSLLGIGPVFCQANLMTLPWSWQSNQYTMFVSTEGIDLSINSDLDSGDVIGAFMEGDTSWVCVGLGHVTSEGFGFYVMSGDTLPKEIAYKVRKVGDTCDLSVALRSNGGSSPNYFSPNTIKVIAAEVGYASQVGSYAAFESDLCIQDSVYKPIPVQWVYYNSVSLTGGNWSDELNVSTSNHSGQYEITLNTHSMCQLDEKLFLLHLEDCALENTVSGSALSTAPGSQIESIEIRANGSFRIFDGQGSLVFSGTGLTRWIGINQSGVPLESGTYYVVFEDGYSTDISIIR